MIDRIVMIADSNLNDDFSDITIVVSDYTVLSYTTGATANDNIFYVNLNESGNYDTVPLQECR